MVRMTKFADLTKFAFYNADSSVLHVFISIEIN